MGRTRFENRHQKRLVYQSIQTHPLPQHLHLVNFLRLFHRIPTTPLPPHPYYPYRDLYHPPTYHHHRERSPQTPIPRRSDVVVSSPIAFEIGDNRDKLANYFNWLAGVYPTMEKQLQECLMILKKKGIVYGTLLDVPAMLWEEWNMLDGLVIMVTGHTKKWEHERAKGRA